MVTYTENGKRAYFDGVMYCRDDKTGYYLNSVSHERLHRTVYEYYNGAIPKGMQVHHKDHDKRNNEPSNLVIMTRADHMKLHGTELTDERRQAMRDNMSRTARPAACEWHGSNAGREWHKKHYEQMKEALHKKQRFVCEYCGKTFETIGNGHTKFCSNNCKSAWRRKSGRDNVTRVCAMCGGDFVVNKYADTKCCSRKCASVLRKSEAHNARRQRDCVQYGS